MSWGAIAGAAISAGGAYLSNKKKKKGATQTTENSVPPWLEDASRSAIGRAEELSRRQYTPFQGNRVAGLSSFEQQQGRLAGAFGDRVASRMRTGFQSADLAQYENPYLDRVLEGRKRAIGEEYGRQSAGLAARQSAMNAFRSGRSDLARSRLDESRMRALDEADAETRSAAFDRAMAARFQDEAQQQGAFELASRGLQSAGLAERSIRQAESDFDYGQYLERRDWDVNNLTPLLNAIAAARGGSMSTTSVSQPGKDMWGAAAGLLGQAITLWDQDRTSSTERTGEDVGGMIGGISGVGSGGYGK
jgi:hypothetical protein